MSKKVVMDYKRELVKEDVPPMTKEQVDALVKEKNLTEEQKAKLLNLYHL